jgi:hypothetical protein
LHPKNILPIILLMLSITSIIIPVSKAQQNPTLSITPNTTNLSTAKIGSIIDVNITIDNAKNIYGWSLNLNWNPKILNLTDIKEGQFLKSAGSTLFTWDPSISKEARSNGSIPGSVVDVLLKAPGVDGSGVLATLSFQVIASGVSSLSLNGSRLASPTSGGPAQKITPAVVDGIVAINKSGESSTPITSPTTVNPHPSIPEFGTISIPTLCALATALLILTKKTLGTKKLTK